MELKADLHTHTRYSDGHGTVEDNVKAAVERGLKAVAITDHGPRGLGIGVKGPGTYFDIMKEARALEKRYPIRIMVGSEANVTDMRGGIDLPNDVIKKLDILIVGLHPFVLTKNPTHVLTWLLPNQAARVSRRLRERLRVGNTKAISAAVLRHPVDVVSHPDLMLSVDVDELAAVCARRGTALEVNTGHDYDKENIVRAATRHGTLLAVNSDAHFPDRVGALETGAALLERMGVPPEQVINTRC